jgi:hypothetical protein
MSLPTTPTSVTKTIPSYLYFQYIDDQNLPSLISSYNSLTQEYVDWFNNVNLPVYTGLEGALLDWVGMGVYGISRPAFSTTKIDGIVGPIASVPYQGPSSSGPSPNIVNVISSTQLYTTTTNYDTPDDIYKRVLTWFFYKGDGFDFSIPWFKKRIARFLFGVDGTDISMPFTPTISVTFDDTTTPQPTCTIAISSSSSLGSIATYFQAAIETGVLATPFRFQYTVTLS